MAASCRAFFGSGSPRARRADPARRRAALARDRQRHARRSDRARPSPLAGRHGPLGDRPLRFRSGRRARSAVRRRRRKHLRTSGHPVGSDAMMNLAEYRNRNPPGSPTSPLGRAGRRRRRAQQGRQPAAHARFRGPDLDSADPAELVAVPRASTMRCGGSARAGRSSSRRSVFAATYPAAHFPIARPRWSTPSAASSFEEEGAHFESQLFLTFLWICRRPRRRCARRGLAL
jgi:hypothetical protein